jgi:hypothetical protein
MNYDPVNFSKNLVKGRIAETLFEQMLRDAGCFTILSFGYEQIIPRDNGNNPKGSRFCRY